MAETITAEEFQRRYGAAKPAATAETITADEFARRYAQQPPVAEMAKQRKANIEAGADLPPGMTPDDFDGGFGQGIKSTLLPSWDGVKQMGKLAGASGPIQQGGAFLDVLKNAAGSANDQRKKAMESLRGGNLIEGGGHALAAAIPILGPAAAQAGEKIADGQIMEGLGEGAGLVAGVLAPSAASKAAGAVAPRVASALDRSALGQYVKALGGNKYENATKEVAQGLIERRVKTSNPRADLAPKAEANAAAVDVDGIAATQAPMDVNSAIQKIEAVKADLYRDVNGVRVPKDVNSEAIAAGLDEYANLLRQHADANGTIPMDAAIDLRRTWSDKPGRAGAWLKDDPRLSDNMAVRTDASQSLGGAINENPAVSAANKEKSFWLKTKDVAKVAPENKPLATPYDIAAITLGSGASVMGLSLGGVASAMGALDVGRRIMTHPAWRTTSAVNKARIADLLQAGDFRGAAAAATAAGITVENNDPGKGEALGYLRQMMQK
jgi:hypothetical protein